MPTLLPVKQGISAAAVFSIPDSWDKNWFRNFITSYLVNADIRNVASGNGITISGNVSGNTNTGSPPSNTVIISQAPIPTDTVMGNVSGSTAVPVALNQTQLTSLVNDFTALLSGAAPASGGGSVNFLRADGTWDIPAGSAAIPNDTVLGNVSGVSAVPVALTQAQLTTLINVFTATLPGSVPASAGGTTKFLRADSTFAVPPNFTSTASGYVPVSGGGTTNFLRADGTFAAPASGASGASPTATIGLAVINGTATTFLRSDGAPPLSQAIVPTWTAAHIFSAASGVPVTINPAGTTTGLIVNGSTTAIASIIVSGLAGSAGADFNIRRAGSTANTVLAGSAIDLSDTVATTATSLQHSGGQFELWMTQNNGVSWSQALKVLTTNQVVVTSAGSASLGALVTSNGPIEAGQVGTSQIILNSNGANFGLIQNDSAGTWSLAYSTVANALGTSVLKWTSNGNITVPTPISGDTLTLGPSATSGALIATNAALTTGAGASLGTLTNAPSAGNPTKWIKINDNGTIRSVPAW